MTNTLQHLFHSAVSDLDSFTFFIKIYAVILSLVGAIYSTKRFLHSLKTRHLRKVWGIKNGDCVIVVCSELDEPEKRQFVQDLDDGSKREFIYNLKYGDVDAYFEVIVTLLRLYPKIKLRILSAGEAESTRMDLTQHLVLIGGPDYNIITENILNKNVTQIDYRCPKTAECSKNHPNEIVIFNTVTGEEYCEFTNEKDYGYFERIKNPHDPRRNIIVLGGCHTIGVTAAVKTFSMYESEHGETPTVVLNNAQLVAKQITKDTEFTVLIKAERLGQTIGTPIIRHECIMLKRKPD